MSKKSSACGPTLEDFFKEQGIQGDAAAAATIKRLGDLWDEGIASGRPKPFDLDELLREARAVSRRPKRGQVMTAKVIWSAGYSSLPGISRASRDRRLLKIVNT